jgi:hypothetical protein
MGGQTPNPSILFLKQRSRDYAEHSCLSMTAQITSPSLVFHEGRERKDSQAHFLPFLHYVNPFDLDGEGNVIYNQGSGP